MLIVSCFSHAVVYLTACLVLTALHVRCQGVAVLHRSAHLGCLLVVSRLTLLRVSLRSLAAAFHMRRGGCTHGDPNALGQSRLQRTWYSLSHCLKISLTRSLILSHCLTLTITHSHTLTIICTCCCDEIKGIQDQHFSLCSFLSLGYWLSLYLTQLLWIRSIVHSNCSNMSTSNQFVDRPQSRD